MSPTDNLTETLSQTITMVPDTIIDALSIAEDAVVTAATTLAEALKPVTANLPESPVNAAELVASSFGIAEKFLANQKDFTLRLLATIAPEKA